MLILFFAASAEATLRDCCERYTKRPQWRRLLDVKTLQAAEDASAFATKDVRWRVLLYKVLGTRIFGQEFVELYDIIATFQQSAIKEVGCSICDNLGAFLTICLEALLT